MTTRTDFGDSCSVKHIVKNILILIAIIGGGAFLIAHPIFLVALSLIGVFMWLKPFIPIAIIVGIVLVILF